MRRAVGAELLRRPLGPDLEERHRDRRHAGYLGPTDGNNRARITLTSAPVSVADGDYFECQVWQSAGGGLDVEADPETWFAIVALEFATFRGAMVRLTATEPVAASTDVAIPGRYRHPE